MKKFDSITADNFAVWEAAATRWILTTDHPVKSSVFKLLDFLPTDIAAHFANENNEALQNEGAVKWLIDKVSLFVGRRPGYDQSKLMQDIWKSNVRANHESIAVWII